MRLHSETFWIHKAGNLQSEYEDAFWPPRPILPHDLIAGDGRLAIADGATESSFSALWARILVRAYGSSYLQSPDSLRKLQPLQTFWNRTVAAKPLPWYAEEKVREGAFASLAGITFRNPLEEETFGSWHAMAVGDSCIVQMRDEQPLIRFPLQASAQFNSRPLLLATKPSANAGIPEVAFHLRNEFWEQGDRFFLMTDALACWFMRECELGARPWTTLGMISGQTEFVDWVQHCRDVKVLKNDDVTLVRVSPYW